MKTQKPWLSILIVPHYPEKIHPFHDFLLREKPSRLDIKTRATMQSASPSPTPSRLREEASDVAVHEPPHSFQSSMIRHLPYCPTTTLYHIIPLLFPNFAYIAISLHFICQKSSCLMIILKNRIFFPYLS